MIRAAGVVAERDGGRRQPDAGPARARPGDRRP
jgi:hypothetical protein